MKTTYDYDNLAGHGVSQSEVDEVLRSAVSAEFDLPPNLRGNQRVMIVGFTTQTARLLELGIEFFTNEDRTHVFHADDAGKYYQLKFEREIKA